MTGRTTPGHRIVMRRAVIERTVARRGETARAWYGTVEARGQRWKRRGFGCVLPGASQPGASQATAGRRGSLKRCPSRRKPDLGVISGTIKRGP